ncbi:MAG: elongation factor G [Clostridiales bacterium]|nr:elongation factor G [Clostridiales bacterium]
MNIYTTDKIRNVVLLGHGGCGKTSLVEAMAYLAGVTSRMGKVTDGNTISDYGKEEQKRQISITTSVIPIEWEGVKINLLDTPGFFDFVGEVEEAVAVADAAIIVVSGKAGVEVGTEKAWELCDKYKLPRFVFVTDMDIDNASFRQVVEDMTEKYGKKMAPFHLPIREEEKFVGYINVITEQAYRWKDKEVVECETPEYSKANLQLCRDALLEAVAETSEEFMERYFNGDSFSEAEIRAALRSNVMEDSIVPMSMGSNVLCQGVFTLLDDIIKYVPSPENREIAGINLKTNEIFAANFDFAKPKSAYIFKTIVDPFIGKYSLIKVNSGVFKSDDVIYNEDKDIEEKISKLYVLQGSKPIEVKELHAGDIGAIAKLTAARTGDTLSTKANVIRYGKTEISTPYTMMRYEAQNKADIDKISQSLQKMTHEDQTLKIVNDAENKQTLLCGMGDLHLEVVTNRLLSEYKVGVKLSNPKVAYRETIQKNSDVEYKYKKQSGGHGQYGHVKIKFEPSGSLEEPYVFEQTVVGGSVPKNYFPAVEKGLQESVQSGPMAAYPVVGVKANLYDGSYHPVDSSEMAFKMATIQAFKKGFMEAKPILLEPIASLKVTVPDAYTGDIMGDLNKRRGRVLGMNPNSEGKQVIEADIPMSCLNGYCTDLRSMTGGRGTYEYQFVRYEQAPSDVQEKEVAARAGKVAAGNEE